MSTLPAETGALWFGESLAEIRVSAEEGGGGVSVIEMTTPYRAMPPLRVADEDECFHVLAGEVTFFVGPDEIAAGPGDSFLAPRGRPHTFRPESEEVRMLVVTTGSFERFLRRVSRPAAYPTPPTAESRPSPEEAGAFARAAAGYGIEILGPPGMLPTDL